MDRGSQTAFSILCIGLDNSGKTTLCRNLSMKTKECNFDLVNFYLEFYQQVHSPQPIQNYTMLIYRNQVSSAQFMISVAMEDTVKIGAIMFVVDASDSEDRFTLQKGLIDDILQDTQVQQRLIPIMVLLNKQDRQNTYNKEELIKDLGLEQKKWKNKIMFKESSGFTGQGLKEAIDQISDTLLVKKL